MAKGVYKGFYDNTKIINALDKTGRKPLLLFVCSRGRSLGKTFSFCHTLYNEFYENGGQFVLLTRRKKELGAVASGIFKSYLNIKHPGVTATEKKQQSGTFSNVYFEHVEDDEDEKGEIIKETIRDHVGYVIPLAAADEIKKISSHFSTVTCVLFDEFQPMQNSTYLKDEVELFDIIHTSIARGQGGGDKSSVRHVPVYMLSNCVNIFNPYFIATGIIKQIQSDTRLYIGDGYIYEKVMVEGAAEKQAEMGIGRILHTSQSEYDKDNTWLLDPGNCVTKPINWGRSIYIATLVYKDKHFAIKYYTDVGIVYVDRAADLSFKDVYNMTLEGGNLNTPYIKHGSIFKIMRDNFMKGKVRYSDADIQSIILDMFA